ncbi:hypothetical protein GGI07_003175 [Coemansia sp. Benny D115]|nr:hypothetical protein GGI07_003175 [Coemansia sp. Benny D115]
MTCQAKTLVLGFDYEQYVHSFIRDFERVFVSDNSDWTGITKLKLAVKDNQDRARNDNGPVVDDSEIASFVDSMRRLVPNIEEIDITGNITNTIYVGIAKRLVEAYSGRLETVDCHNPEVISAARPANPQPAIKSLDIDCSRDDIIYPPIEMLQGLTSLTIHNITDNLFWNMQEVYDAAADISGFVALCNGEPKECMNRFPALKTIDISCQKYL